VNTIGVLNQNMNDVKRHVSIMLMKTGRPVGDFKDYNIILGIHRAAQS
jgi:hypothetical protein